MCSRIPARVTHRFIAPVLQHIQLSLNHSLHRDSANTFTNTHTQLITALTLPSEGKSEITSQVTAEVTSSMLGMISRSHSLRKESLSKEGSTFKISVRTSDISVLENSPPKHQVTDARDHQRNSRAFRETLNWSPRDQTTQENSQDQPGKKYSTSPRGGHFW